MTDLLINIDHVATLRNARRELFPDPVAAASLCETAGADGIVFHLREDRRHITERDVAGLKAIVRGRLDFELSMAPDIVHICCETVPELATLVPERREEITTEEGLDVLGQSSRISEVVESLFSAGIEDVALFVDPVPEQVEAAKAVGASAIEMHTGDFALASGRLQRASELKKLAVAAEVATNAGLRVHAGHGLDFRNYASFAQAVPHVAEVSIGFAVVARAVFVGLHEAVREMRKIVKGY